MSDRSWLGFSRRWAFGQVVQYPVAVVSVGEDETDGAAVNLLEALVSAAGLAPGLWAQDVDLFVLAIGVRGLAAPDDIDGAIVTAEAPETIIVDAETLRRTIPGDDQEPVMAIERTVLNAMQGHGVTLGASGDALVPFHAPILVPVGHAFFLAAGGPADQIIGRWLYRVAA